MAPASAIETVASQPVTNVPSPIDREMIRSACAARNAAGFVFAFVQSPAVRGPYIADSVNYLVRRVEAPFDILRQERIDGSRYDRFPLETLDYYYRAVLPATPGDDDEFLMVELNQSQSDQLSVEWTRVHFDGQSEGGDDLGNAYTLEGEPYQAGAVTDGQLLFEPVGDCWQLVADIRHVHP